MKILLVEDDAKLASVLNQALARFDIVVDEAGSIASARELCELQGYDAIVLDRQLPDGDGMSLIPSLRQTGNITPILVLTARGELSDRVEGLYHGADDYLTKPFAVEELVARLRALFRRPPNIQSDVVTVGNVRFDFLNRDTNVDGKPLDLTRRETLVLETLLRRAGRMVSRAVLMNAVFTLDDDVQPNALDTQVSRLRRKLSDVEARVIISGVRGLGYMLREVA
ncbi:MAG: response regulator transcription factor [Sphingomonas sp.]|uniref:response regulator n=1 Tax=Sphingomonas sp. TaxID=28214 RepID=UPI0026273403|nr:response regulator transcription factor [Sphingomonas sp.]MDK2770542.1 response regulator transcription factor [Sphingomonas sp.]